MTATFEAHLALVLLARAASPAGVLLFKAGKPGLPRSTWLSPRGPGRSARRALRLDAHKASPRPLPVCHSICPDALSSGSRRVGSKSMANCGPTVPGLARGRTIEKPYTSSTRTLLQAPSESKSAAAVWLS